jgi:hypothetical protein
MNIIKLIIITGFISLFGFSNKPPNYNKANTPFRGFMIDAPRGVESLDYYFNLINFCQKEGLNSIIFRLTDDEGSAYHFKSHPELKTCEGAFSAEDLKRLVAYSDSKGVEIIPEIESFGHTRYITDVNRYKFLNDGVKGGSFNSVCPVSDTAHNLMEDLYQEISAIFTSNYFHIGCDEVNWGGSEMSQKALRAKSKYQIWADYINTLNEYVKILGKKTIIWGDVPIYHEKEVLDLLSRDIVIMDWNYWETKKGTVDSIAKTILSKGFQVIGCPAVSWCRWGPRVGALQFENINAYAEVYCNLNNSGNLGIVLSNWVPQRYIQNSQWDTYTIAAEILKNKGNYNYMQALPEFVKSHFGVPWDASWEKIYRITYEKAPQSFCAQNASSKFLLWSTGQEVENILRKNLFVENSFSEIKKMLLDYKSRVKKNKKDYNDFLLTIEFIEYSYNRQNSLITFANAQRIDEKSVSAYIKKVALEDSTFLSKIDIAWQRGRRNKTNEMQKGKDYMMSFYKAAHFSRNLIESPLELISILKKKR